MDVRLANGSSGIDAARELYAHHGLRCFFVSANVDERTMAALQSLQPIDFVDKPILPLMLKRALEMAQCALPRA
jgi:hypothetical protein